MEQEWIVSLIMEVQNIIILTSVTNVQAMKPFRRMLYIYIHSLWVLAVIVML